jgi:hypothetical protein
VPQFTNALRAWPSAGFAATLKREIEALDSGSLPLAAAAGQGRYVDDASITASVLRVDEAEGAIEAAVGVFFTAVVGSCGCGDEPYAENAYCELRVRIDRATGEAEFALSPE